MIRFILMIMTKAQLETARQQLEEALNTQADAIDQLMLEDPIMTLSVYNMIWWVLVRFCRLFLGGVKKKGKEQARPPSRPYGQPHFDPRLSGVIWLHSVSIGETIAAISLAKALAQTQPEAKFLITTNTVSAAELVHRETATGFPLFHAFQPLDHPSFLWTAFWLRLIPSSPFLWSPISGQI